MSYRLGWGETLGWAVATPQVAIGKALRIVNAFEQKPLHQLL